MRPNLLLTKSLDESFAGVKYNIEGELVPVLTVELNNNKKIYFEHHILLWKDSSIVIGLRPMKGVAKRMIAGIQIFVTQASGSGQIAFSRDGVGHVFAIHLKRDQEIDIREHQFLAATEDVDYGFERVKGFSNMLFGGTGFFIDKFKCHNDEGILWLHGYGNVFEKVLKAGETLDVEPGGWLYKDSTVSMQTNVQSFSTGIFASSNIVMNRFTGPGRVGIQSMYLNTPQ